MSEPVYQTIQVVPLALIQPEFDKLHKQIDELSARLLNRPDESPLSDDEAARRIGKSPSTLRRMKVDGRISSVRTPHGLMVRACDVSDYLASKTGKNGKQKVDGEVDGLSS